MIIGSHVSFSKEQLLGSVKEALSYGANTFMVYTGAPHNTLRSKLNDEYIEKAKELMINEGINIDNVICHAPYIINLANKLKPDAWNFSINFLKQELSRCKYMGIKYIVVHPGNALTIPREEALLNISEALNFVLDGEDSVTILLETMAGKGTECGINVDEIKVMIDNIKNKEMIGVCLDTCHINDAGFKFDEYLSEFDSKIGIEKIKCIHMNDSKNPAGSHKDRHENIGFGTLGFDSFINILNNDKLKDVPKILETPYVPLDSNSKVSFPPYKFEIAMLKNGKFKENLKEEIIAYYK